MQGLDKYLTTNPFDEVRSKPRKTYPNTKQALILAENRQVTVAKSNLSNIILVCIFTGKAYFYGELKFID